MSTKVIDARSKSERGRSAERMPSGIAISIQSTAPPKTSDAVTGAASATSVVDALAVEVRAAQVLVDDQVLEEVPVLLVDRPVEAEDVRDPLDVTSRCTPGRRPAWPGSPG